MNRISGKTVILFVCLSIFLLSIINYTYSHWFDHQSTQNCSSKNNCPVPSTFGHTHFIVGMSADEMNQVQQESCEQPDSDTPSCSGSLRKAHFSPDDGLEKKLIELIDQEKISLKIAVFQFTNGQIARAIKRAQLRGVVIDIITDPLCLQDKFNKITWMAQEGIKVYVYNPDANISALSNKMHHKFVIFGKNIENKKLIWIGSFNFTKSADIANQESVVVLDDNQIISQFDRQYSRLKERSVKLDDFAKYHFIAPTTQPALTDLKNRSSRKTSVAYAKKVSSRKKNKLTISVVA